MIDKILASVVLAGVAIGAGSAQALTADEAKTIAMDAYIYGYSLVTTNVTRVQMTNVAETKEGVLRGPVGHFINVKRYPPADYRGVSAPNADTLYSVAWVDLAEPQVFSQPAMPNDRYYLFPMYDLWMTDFASKGSRTTGQEAANYLLTRSDWSGDVPEGMTHMTAETRYMLILGRIYSTGSDKDYAAVNALQDQLKITPLADWGTDRMPAVPPVDENPGFSMTDKPQQVILDMGTEGYFKMVADLMCKDAPPAAADTPMVEKMAQIGVVPCETFELSKLDAEIQASLKDLPNEALAKITKNQSSLGTVVDGYVVTKGLGQYGTDYMKRAVVAAFGWPANVEQDAVYPYTDKDSTGAKLTGASDYTLTFAKGEEPPVKGFWSITMYEIDNGWWFVPNELNKFTVSPRNDLQANADGSVTLYFQNESPGADKQANWLPAPKGDFIVMLRMYWPSPDDPSILNGTWMPPQVMQVN